MTQKKHPFSINAASHIQQGCMTHQAILSDEQAEEIKARDKYSCYFCGYSSKDNEVHHLNHHHQDNRTENLTTICTICHEHQHLEKADKADRIVYLPDIPHSDVAHMLRSLYTSLSENSENAQSLLHWLHTHDSYTELSYTTACPQAFAQAIQQTPEKEQHHIAATFPSLYLVRGKHKVADTADHIDMSEQWIKLHKDANRII